MNGAQTTTNLRLSYAIPIRRMLLPTFDELPKFKDLTGCAWGLWPEGNELGTVNLLTEEVVLRAAKEEIR